MSSDTAAGKTPSKRKYLVLIGVIVIVVAGWSGAWAYGRTVLADQLDMQFGRFSEQGTEVTCTDLTIGGYPWRYEIRCDDLKSRDLSGSEGAMGGLTAVALVYNPWHVILEAATPAAVSLPLAGVSGDLTWETARASARYSTEALGKVDVVVTKPALRVQNPAAEARVVSEKAEFHLRPSPETTGAVDGFFSIDGLMVEQLPSLTNPVDARMHLQVLNGAPLLSGADLRSLVLANGGELPVRLVLAEVALGASRFGGRGDLTVNGAGALSGTLTLTLVQPSNMLNSIRPLFPPNSNEFSIVESLLSSLQPTGTDHLGDPAIEIPLLIDNGLMRMGFVTLGRIPPLFQAGS
ncbi:DUF2125 domain-containing protein [Roseibium sp.]|uniref:DUF2125 domain-containing protein n=1 Tax=Roseibium sp. TaxID=1936156 RepID=UPI00391ACCA6